MENGKDISSREVSDSEYGHDHENHFEKKALRKEDLRSDRINKDVLIDPFYPENFKSEKYRLTLGKFYFTSNPGIAAINPESPEMNSEYWGKYRTAEKYVGGETKIGNLRKDERYIKIPAGKTVLTHTHEFIGVSEGMSILFTPIQELVSSLLSVEICIGGNYFDRCIVTIRNNSDSIAYIRVGSAISEVTFFRSSTPDDGTGFGKDKQALQQIQSSWKAVSLLIKKPIKPIK